MNIKDLFLRVLVGALAGCLIGISIIIIFFEPPDRLPIWLSVYTFPIGGAILFLLFGAFRDIAKLKKEKDKLSEEVVHFEELHETSSTENTKLWRFINVFIGPEDAQTLVDQELTSKARLCERLASSIFLLEKEEITVSGIEGLRVKISEHQDLLDRLHRAESEFYRLYELALTFDRLDISLKERSWREYSSPEGVTGI